LRLKDNITSEYVILKIIVNIVIYDIVVSDLKLSFNLKKLDLDINWRVSAGNKLMISNLRKRQSQLVLRIHYAL